MGGPKRFAPVEQRRSPIELANGVPLHCTFDGAVVAATSNAMLAETGQAALATNELQAGLRLLRRADVGRLFVAYFVTYTGSAMAPIAIAFGVLELTGSTRDASFVIAAPTLASIAMLVFGGVLADRTSRQRVLVSAETLAMFAQATIALLFLSGLATVPLLALLMLVNGLALALQSPAIVGFIIQVVDREEFQTLNALLGTARNGAMAGGAALGGILVTTFGAGATLALDAFSFGVSALLIASLRPRAQVLPELASVLEDLRLGWREFTSHTWLWVIVAQFSLVLAVHESVFGLLGPAVARAQMSGAQDWGVIAGSFGLGTLLGGVFSLQIRPRHPMRIATLLTFTFCLVPLSLSGPCPVAVVACAAFVQGVAGQIFGVIWHTALQQKIPGHLLSRVSAYDHMGSIALAPLGIVAGGFLFEQIGARTTLLSAAATVLVPTILALGVVDVRNMVDREEDSTDR